MKRIVNLAAVSAFTMLAAACQGHRTVAMDNTENGRPFPPKWRLSDLWRVSIRTEALLPADQQPAFVERVYRFQVNATPQRRGDLYRIDVRSEDPRWTETYELYYREDFSLAQVKQRSQAIGLQVVADNDQSPFIYSERRIPIIPDFPVVLGSPKTEFAEFKVKKALVTERAQMENGDVRYTLERREPGVMLRTVLVWRSGEPWWSTAECTEKPPGTLPAYVVASGRLLERGASNQK